MSEESQTRRITRILIERLKYTVDCNVRDEQMIRENMRFIKTIPDGYTEEQIINTLFELFLSHYNKSPNPSLGLRIIPKPKTFTTDIVLERKNNIGNDTTTFVWNLIRRQEKVNLGDVATNKTHDMQWITSIRVLPFNLSIANNSLDAYQIGILIREFYQQSYRSAKGFRYNFVLPNGVPISVIYRSFLGTDEPYFSTSRFSNTVHDGSLLKFSKPVERLERITMSFYKTDTILTLFTLTTRDPNISITSVTGVYSGTDAVMFTLTNGSYNTTFIPNDVENYVFQVRGVTTTDPVTDAAWIAAINIDYHYTNGGPVVGGMYAIDDALAAELPQDGTILTTIRYVYEALPLGVVVPVLRDATFTILANDFQMQLRFEHLSLSS